METSRVDGVKAPPHRGTPKSRELLLVLYLVVGVYRTDPFNHGEDQGVALAVVYA